MSYKLSTMVYNKHTRIAGETLLYYNLGAAQRIGALIFDGSTTQRQQEASCAETLALPTSGFSAGVIVVPNKSVCKATGMAATYPVLSPIGAAQEIDAAPSLVIGDYSFATAPTVAGDQLDIYALPNPANDVLICYDQGFSQQLGERFRPIKRKLNPADHYVLQRPENKITLSDLLVSAWDGLQRINGMSVTLIARVYPDGGSVPSQICYFTNCRLTVPSLDVGAEGNDSIENKAEGTFNQQLNFAAMPS